MSEARDRLIRIGCCLADAATWGQSPDWDVLKSVVIEYRQYREQCQSVRFASRCALDSDHAGDHHAGLKSWSTVVPEPSAQRAALHAVRDAYGGNPSDPVWDTPEGIAGIIEELGCRLRFYAAQTALDRFEG